MERPSAQPLGGTSNGFLGCLWASGPAGLPCPGRAKRWGLIRSYWLRRSRMRSGGRSNAPRHGWRRKRSGGRPPRPLGPPSRATAPQRAPLRGKLLVTCPRPRRRSLPRLGVACIGSVSDVRRRPMACTGALCPTRAGRPHIFLPACPKGSRQAWTGGSGSPRKGLLAGASRPDEMQRSTLGRSSGACLPPGPALGRWARRPAVPAVDAAARAGPGILDTQERRHHTSARFGAVAQLGER